MPNFNKEEKIISLSLFLGGVISNSIGVIVSLIYAHLNRFNLFNFISTSSSLLIIITLFTILWKKQLYLLYAKVIVVITAFIFFPTILLTSPDAIFFPYIGILGSSFGFLNFKNYKFTKIGILALIHLIIVFLIKTIFRINIKTNYVPNNILHILGGLSASYLFSLFITSKISYNYFHLLEKTKLNTVTDTFTGAYNRFYINEINFDNSCIIMLDIDFFKKLNDNYGHINGDKSLIFLVNSVKTIINKNDTIIRYGGEEFLIILSNSDLQRAIRTAEKIRTFIMLNSKNEKTIKKEFTVSLGVSKYNEELSFEDNIKIVDSYLYVAKNNGRNQVYYR